MRRFPWPFRPPSAADLPDAVLLGRFRRQRDANAFAELVRRHGPVVWGVCRRHLSNTCDAEDAFQATFLVLVRKAGSLPEADSVGPWLHRVAVMTCRNALRTLRRKSAGPLVEDPTTPDASDAADARTDLDAALLALPEKLRVPVVLCHLQGWSRREAAEHLGCPEGTLSALLSRALARLRTKLGVGVPAAVLAVAVSMTPSKALAAATGRAADLYVSSTAAPAVSPAVAGLTRKVLRMFWLKKLPVAAGLVTLALTAGLFAARGADDPKPATPAKQDDKPKADKPKVASPVGLWLGVLKVGVIDLRLAFQIDADKDDKEKLTAKMFSIDQTDQALPVKTVTFADGKLTLEVASVGAKFEGKMNEKGDTISGTFEQGASFPLKLERIEKLPTMNRPQTPMAPFPYPTEDVTFENKEAKDLTVKENPPNVMLAGTLTLPKGDGPFPAVVLVSGSGPQDRDETIFGHKPFLVLADHFAKNGIACLRFDDRGIAKSKGKFGGSTSADFATDAYAAVTYLKGRKEIDPKRIGVCGHSEGGVIAPLVAAAHPDDVGFIILLAGPGVSGERILYQQALDFSKLLDEKTDEKEIREFVDAVMPIMRSDKKGEEVKNELTEVMKKMVAKEKDEKTRKAAEANLGASVSRLTDPWMRWFVSHDPAPTLAKVKCPVLAVNGEKDLQVKAKDNLEVIESSLKKGGNKSIKCVEFKSLNHLFQTCKTGMLSEYGQIEETIAPEVLKSLTEWINERK